VSQKWIKALGKEMGIKGKRLFMPLRVALTVLTQLATSFGNAITTITPQVNSVQFQRPRCHLCWFHAFYVMLIMHMCVCVCARVLVRVLAG
jgi:hypothetical protein